MSLIKWQTGSLDPVTTMRRMLDDLDSTFSQLPGIFSTSNGLPSNFMPRVDVNDDEKNLYIQVELPGLSEQDVKLTLTDNILTIRGEKKRNEEHKERNHYRIERSYGEFVRQFTLPEDVKQDDIEANFSNGVLDIQIPKAEPVTPRERTVEIKSASSPKQGTRLAQGEAKANGNIHIDSDGKLGQESQIRSESHSPSKNSAAVRS